MKMTILLFLFSFSLHASENSTVVEYIDRIHKDISSHWDSWNSSIDSFFANEIYEDEVSNSHIKFDFTTRAIEDAAVTYDVNFTFKVDFPNASKKIKLIVEEDKNRYVENDLEEARNLTAEENAQNIEESLDNSNISAALRYTSLETRRWKIYSDGGLRFNLPLNPFTKMRIRRKYELSEWSLFLIQNFSYYYQEHFKSTSQFQAHHNITDDFKITFSTSLNWFSSSKEFNLTHSLTLYQRVSDQTAFSYSLSTHAGTVPSLYYDMYGLSMRLRHSLHENWLFMQLGYGANFMQENRYYVLHYATLKLQMVF